MNVRDGVGSGGGINKRDKRPTRGVVLVFIKTSVCFRTYALNMIVLLFGLKLMNKENHNLEGEGEE